MPRPRKSVKDVLNIIRKVNKLQEGEYLKLTFWRVDRFLEYEGVFIKIDREAQSIFMKVNSGQAQEIPIMNIYQIKTA